MEWPSFKYRARCRRRRRILSRISPCAYFVLLASLKCSRIAVAWILFVRGKCTVSGDSRNRKSIFRCQGRVVMSAGPWRVEGEWWKEEPFNRDYYDVQLSDGGVYRLYYDRDRTRWFVDGYYD